MSGQLLLKRVLLEKEKALDKRQLVSAYIALGTAFTLTVMGYSTLTYLAAEPALSHPPDSDLAKISHAAPNSLNEPESGVKLLLSIFSRLWPNSSQLAMLPPETDRWRLKPDTRGYATKAKAASDTGLATSDAFSSQNRQAAEPQFNQALASNAADPALSIRPQVNKRAALDEIATIAPGSQANGQLQQAQSSLSQAPPPPPASPAQQAAPTRSLEKSSWYKSSQQIKIVSESPEIKEFSQGSRRDSNNEFRAKLLPAKKQATAAEEPTGHARLEHSNLIEQSKELAAANSSDSVSGIIRPLEQPGLFKYVREYYKDQPKNLPASTPTAAGAPVSIPQILEGSPLVSDARLMDDKDVAGKTVASGGLLRSGGGGLARAGAGYGGGGAKSMAASFDVQKDAEFAQGYGVNFKAGKRKQSNALQLAFLPPNAVHGIIGLALGATSAETIAFLKGHGKFSKILISGFQIYTLKGDRGTTTLQAFVRGDRLEALRVFSSTYVPPQLGVNLGEDLPSMKAKFGEPAFILEEPRAKENAPPVVAKNYVYPVSQARLPALSALCFIQPAGPQHVAIQVFIELYFKSSISIIGDLAAKSASTYIVPAPTG